MWGILDLFKVKGIQTPNAVVMQASGCTFSMYAFWPPTQSLNQGYHTPHRLPVLLGTVLPGPPVLEAVPSWGVLAGGRGLPDSAEGSQLCILHTWRMYWSRDSFSDPLLWVNIWVPGLLKPRAPPRAMEASAPHILCWLSASSLLPASEDFLSFMPALPYIWKDSGYIVPWMSSWL